MNKSHIITISIAFLLTGCITPEPGSIRLGGHYYPPKKDNCRISVYTSGKEINKPYKAVCLIDSEIGASDSLAQAVDRTKKYACRCGANALIIDSSIRAKEVRVRDNSINPGRLGHPGNIGTMNPGITDNFVIQKVGRKVVVRAVLIEE